MVGALAILLALGNLLVVRPIRAKHREIHEGAVAQRRVLKDHLQILAYKAQAAKEYEKVAKYVCERQPEEEPDQDMLKEAVRLATTCGLSVLSRKPDGFGVQDEFLQEYIVQMEVKGSIVNMIQFLYRLRVSSQLMRVQWLKLTPQGREKGVKKGVLRITKLVSV
jgi:hypothetical protein